MIKTIETQADIAEGVRYLSAKEPRFAPVVQACGLPPLRRRAAGLEGLLAIITDQQISLHAAAAIWTRLEARFAPFDAVLLRNSPDEDFAACGLSRPKIRTIRAILDACMQGSLDFSALHEMPDDEVGLNLTAIHGIGPWTAGIFLLSNLGRRDVWPSGDIALQEAARMLFELPARPDDRQLNIMAADWQPWRAVAARLLWSHYRAVKFKA